ncbi:VanW family protein [Halalkalibacterium ligniniphilum]|uniref:VanW family protein n=1 Tax=Halalkalibacterium ligniniphilum TaxID=1134413 RepID=UPI000346C323|nr:VanW family protein [Halalkalibacterium ligniniphilum]
MNRILFFKTWLLLCGLTAFFLSFSYAGSWAFEHYGVLEERLPEQTSVGEVNVSNDRLSTAKEKLEEEMIQWKDRASISIVFYEKRELLSSEFVSFHIEEAIQEAQQQGKGTLEGEVSRKEADRVIERLVPADILPFVQRDALYRFIEEQLVDLQKVSIEVDISDYLTETYAVSAEDVAAVASIQSNEPLLYLQQWAPVLNDMVIEAKGFFSLQGVMEENGEAIVEGDALRILSSALYQAFVQSNFQLIERHIGHILPPEIEPGYDAYVNRNEMDLKVYNPNHHSYRLKVSYEGNELSVALIGKAFIYDYRLELTEEREIQPERVVQFSPTRRSGDRQVLVLGQTGHLYTMYRTVYRLTGEEVESERWSEDYYPPQHQIEEWSLKEQDQVPPQPSVDPTPLNPVPQSPIFPEANGASFSESPIREAEWNQNEEEEGGFQVGEPFHSEQNEVSPNHALEGASKGD